MLIIRLSSIAVILFCMHSVAVAQTHEQSAWSTDAPAAKLVNTRPTFPSLAPRSIASEDGAPPDSEPSGKALSGPTVTVASSLAVVLGLFAGMIWLTRRFGGGASSNRTLPREAVEVLGSITLEPRLKVSLVRIGSRVVVLAQTAQGVQPISEITDMDEANRLIATCRGEATEGFANELKSIEREPYTPGFVEPTNEPAPRRRLFATA